MVNRSRSIRDTTSETIMDVIKPTKPSTKFDPAGTASPPAGGDHGGGDDDTGGPSWGLIIPIIMIAVFLACVALCLWWHRWQDRRRMRINKHNVTTGSSFHRSYRSGRKNSRGAFDAIRDSTRSTTPLRSSLNEKNSGFPLAKTINVNVVPVPHRPATTPNKSMNKYSFYWDKTQWRAMPTPLARSGTKPLSPIDEIDSPTSAKLSELSRNYESVGARSFSPYHLTWLSSTNAPPSYEESENASVKRAARHPSVHRGANLYSPQVRTVTEQSIAKSPYFPNNNTPTTEVDTESESSQPIHHYADNSNLTSQYTSHPSSPTPNTVLSRSNPLPSRNTSSTDEPGMTSLMTSSYHGSSYQTSSKQSQSARQPSSLYYTSQSNTDYTSTMNTTTDQPTEHSTNISSLPSSIAPFSKHNIMLNNNNNLDDNQTNNTSDSNNNSLHVPNANHPMMRPKALNYTLASSVSSDTHLSDNTSMIPNIGSNNTSGYPAGYALRSSGQPSTAEPSGPASPEDLSKLVDEMSSIRHVDESSSLRPNSSVDPTPRITTISGTSLSAGMQRSWSVNAEFEHQSGNSTNESSQLTSRTDGSMYWDNYPLTAPGAADDERSRSHQELPLHVYENQNFLGHVVELNYHVPILMDQQYWV